MKDWVYASEIAGIGGMPKSPSNVTRKATKEGWERQQVEGVKGVSYVYAFRSLPPQVQAELLLRESEQKLNVKSAVENLDRSEMSPV